MAGFNPDKFLAETAQSSAAPFDPDKFLAETGKSLPSQTKPLTGEEQKQDVYGKIKQMNESGDTSNEALLNTLTMGYLPQIKAKAGQILSGEGVSNDANYLKRRDQAISEMNARAEKYPGAHLEGTAVGIIAPAMLTGGASAADSAPALAGQVAKQGVLKAAAKGAAASAVLAGAANPGDIQGVVDPLQTSERLSNAKTGAMIGAPLAVAANQIPNAAKYISSLADKKAFKAAGAMLKDFRKANDAGVVEETGRFMLDNGLVKAGDTYESIADKANKIVDSTGKDLGKGYEAAQKIIPQLPPEAQEKISAAGFNPVRDRDVIISDVSKELENSPEKKSVINHVSNYLDQLAEDHGDRVLSPLETNKIKTKLDKVAINWERNPLAREPEKEAGYKALRSYLGDKVSAQVDAVGNAIGDNQAAQSLKDLNKRYATASRVSRIADDRASRESAKAAYGIPEAGLSAAGAAIGTTALGPVGGVAGFAAGAGVSKVARKYGPAVVASSTNAAAKAISKLPQEISGRVAAPALSAAVGGKNSISSLMPAAQIASPSQPDKKQDVAPAEQAPLKGRDKWAEDGFDNLIEHIDDEESQKDFEDFKGAMLSDPKAKDLLVQASDLKPGSKAMRKIMAQIQTRINKEQA